MTTSTSTILLEHIDRVLAQAAAWLEAPGFIRAARATGALDTIRDIAMGRERWSRWKDLKATADSRIADYRSTKKYQTTE